MGKKDLEDLELAYQKIEQEKTNRDHTLRNLTDEVSSQDEAINKLNKEKKMAGDNNARASDDLAAAGEKVDHLNSVKGKLESTLDDLESAKREMEGLIGRREKDSTALAAKLEDEQNIVAKLMKGIKEHQGRVEELEEELEAERQARSKAEKQR